MKRRRNDPQEGALQPTNINSCHRSIHSFVYSSTNHPSVRMISIFYFWITIINHRATHPSFIIFFCLSLQFFFWELVVLLDFGSRRRRRRRGDALHGLLARGRNVRCHRTGRFLRVGQRDVDLRFVLLEEVLEEGIVQELGTLGLRKLPGASSQRNNNKI